MFHLKENNTTVKTEVVAGITTFMTMAYILAVNPDILSASGMDKHAILMATALAAFIGTLAMQIKLLSEIHEDSQWLVRMVENLLSVTRIDDNITKIAKTPVVLDELLDSVIVKFKKHYPNQKVQISAPSDFISIPMDAILIQQVLMNIMENAIMHAEGMSELEVSVRIEDNNAIFEIKDDGCGIPEERLPHLFTGYLDRDSSVPTDGSRNNMGIGLSVCSTIIKAHGGSIYAKNRPEGGALFGFSLEMEEENE